DIHRAEHAERENRPRGKEFHHVRTLQWRLLLRNCVLPGVQSENLRRSLPMTRPFRSAAALTGMLVTMGVGPIDTWADETCNSPYISNLIKGQEDFVHVWTLGEPGLGDASDKLVTIDANPKSKTYGKVVSSVSVSGRGEAHHMGFTDDRKFLW